MRWTREKGELGNVCGLERGGGKERRIGLEREVGQKSDCGLER